MQATWSQPLLLKALEESEQLLLLLDQHRRLLHTDEQQQPLHRDQQQGQLPQVDQQQQQQLNPESQTGQQQGQQEAQQGGQQGRQDQSPRQRQRSPQGQGASAGGGEGHPHVANASDGHPHVAAWLGAVRHLLRLCRGSGGTSGLLLPSGGLSAASPLSPAGLQAEEATPGAAGRGDAARRVRQCEEALAALALAPELSPALVLHPQQAEALRPWLEAPQGTQQLAGLPVDTFLRKSGGGAHIDRAGSSGVTAGATGFPVSCMGSSAGHGSQLPSSLQLHEEYSLDLEGQLCDWSLEAEDLARDLGLDLRRGLAPGTGVDQRAAAPVMVRLPWQTQTRILSSHPDEGVRWQVCRGQRWRCCLCSDYNTQGLGFRVAKCSRQKGAWHCSQDGNQGHG